jgi:DNA invertase Pin-like site-specific DNA recombinase
VREFVDVETARQSGRRGFGEMIAALKTDPSCRTILVEKTERLYRNTKDWMTVDDLATHRIEVHPTRGPLITKLFELYATGQYSLRAVTARAHAAGLTHPRSGRRTMKADPPHPAEPDLHR